MQLSFNITKFSFFISVLLIVSIYVIVNLVITYTFKEKVQALENDTVTSKACFRQASDYTDLSNNRKLVRLSDDNNITSCKTFVTIEEFPFGARTGNQMFIVAAIIGLAYKYDAIPVIPRSSLTEYFILPYISNITTTNNVVCKSPSMIFNNCSTEFSMAMNVTLVGYLQSFKYFADIRGVIKQTFKFQEKFIIRAREYFKTVYKQNFQHVCIHVRRTDFVLPNFVNIGYRTADVGFFIKAMKFYKSNYSEVEFIVISDDIAWCKKNLNGTNVSFSPFTDTGDDLALMTLCNHVIVTSGTFGWWGAWLAGGTTVYFKDYIIQGSELMKEMKTEDYYPPDWIGMN